MRKLDVTPITDSSQFPVKKGTLQFLQDAYTETLAAILQAIVNPNVSPAYDPTKAYILFGVVNSTAAPLYTVSAGAILYQGEIFYVDATGFTATGSNVAVLNISTTQYTTDADPVTFTDSVVRNVHNIRKMVVSQAASGSGISDLSSCVTPGFYIPPQVNIQAPTTGGFVGNTAQVSGSYPNISLFVPPVSTHNIKYAGNFNIGAVGVTGTVIDGNTCSAYNVTFPDVGTASYTVGGCLVAISGSDEANAAVSYQIHNKASNGFVLVCKKKDNASGTTNLSFDFTLTI